jgi:hypothetical protein
MVGPVAAAHPRPWQPGLAVVTPATSPHAQLHHPPLAQILYLGGVRER